MKERETKRQKDRDRETDRNCKGMRFIGNCRGKCDPADGNLMKNFVKKEDKSPSKAKLKLKDPLSSKREFKLTVSRAMNVEEVEIKQRSLASVKRSRLKDKRSENNEDKKEIIKVIMCNCLGVRICDEI